MDLGDDVLMLYIEQTTAQEFAAYCTAMKDAGYTEFANRQYGNNLHAIYTSEEKVVHVTYAAKEKAVRIAIEDAYDMSIFTEQPYEKICELSVTMIGQENYEKDDNGFYYQKGMSLIFRLEDGRFIIVDGGGHNNTSRNNLYKTLQNLAVDKDNITIAAWIIPQAHTDHVGTFLKFTAASYHKNYNAKALALAEEAYIAGANIFTLIMPYTPEDGETTRIIY